MARAKHRGTGPKPNKNKITIGDGSIRDLAYWLIGGDVSVKRGGKKASSSTVREEFKKTVPTILSKARPSLFDSYYNPLTDYEGKYSPDEKERQARDPIQKKPFIRPVDFRAYKPRGNHTLPEKPVQDRFNPTQPRPASPTSTQLNRSVPLMGRGPQRPPTNPNIAREALRDRERSLSERFKRSVPADWQREQPEEYPPTLAYMGGPVKRRKRKKYMGGGKMKKYAKGGGIRKPKYS